MESHKRGRQIWREIGMVAMMCVIVLLYTETSGAFSQEAAQTAPASPKAIPLLPHAPGPSGTPALQAPAAPTVAPLPYARLIGVLVFGFLAGYVRLLHKFRRYWGLGVTTNIYAAMYVAAGPAACSLLHMLGNSGGFAPRIQATAPLMADLAGVALAWLGPSLGPRVPLAGAQGPFQFKTDRNRLFAVLGEAVLDRIKARIHRELALAVQQYSWSRIRRAGQQALQVERNLGALGQQAYRTERNFVDALPDNALEGVDLVEKYDALMRLLGYCPFRHLNRFLNVSSTEAGR